MLYSHDSPHTSSWLHLVPASYRLLMPQTKCLASRCQESEAHAKGKYRLQEELLSHLNLPAGTGNNARILANVTSPFS
jgi:hypothetical protein